MTNYIFFQKTNKLLEHLISHLMIKPDPDYLRPLSPALNSASLTQVMVSFVYHAKWIPNNFENEERHSTTIKERNAMITTISHDRP